MTYVIRRRAVRKLLRLIPLDARGTITGSASDGAGQAVYQHRRSRQIRESEQCSGSAARRDHHGELVQRIFFFVRRLIDLACRHKSRLWSKMSKKADCFWACLAIARRLCLTWTHGRLPKAYSPQDRETTTMFERARINEQLVLPYIRHSRHYIGP